MEMLGVVYAVGLHLICEPQSCCILGAKDVLVHEKHPQFVKVAALQVALQATDEVQMNVYGVLYHLYTGLKSFLECFCGLFGEHGVIIAQRVF